jgi:hypothetical protein
LRRKTPYDFPPLIRGKSTVSPWVNSVRQQFVSVVPRNVKSQFGKEIRHPSVSLSAEEEVFQGVIEPVRRR